MSPTRPQQNGEATTPPPPSTSARQHLSRLPLLDRSATPNSTAPRPRWTSRITERLMIARGTASTPTKTTSKSLTGFVTTDLNAAHSSHSTPTPPTHMNKPLPPMPLSEAGDPSPFATTSSTTAQSQLDSTSSEPGGTVPTDPTVDISPVSALSSTIRAASPIFEKGDNCPKAKAAQDPSTATSSTAHPTKTTTEDSVPKTHAANRTSVSSRSSYQSAHEVSTASTRKVAAADQAHGMSSPRGPSPPMRTSSYRTRIPSNSLIPQPVGSACKSKGYQDLALLRARSPAVTDSRPHSPSPRSFSRPRPGSFSLTTPDNSNVVQTASRLAIADSRKPQIVDVKPRNSQGSTKDSYQPPMFGSRRLDAKTADILDNGIKRRQLLRKCKDTERDSSEVISPFTNDDVLAPDTPAHSLGCGRGPCRSVDLNGFDAMRSDYDLTSANSASEDESEVATPADRPPRYSKRFQQAPDVAGASQDRFHEPCAADQLDEITHPPPTSAYTAPLPAIPSEATLPFTWLSEDGKITEALSHLEGKGIPPRRDVDDSTLFQMFGHMAKTFEARNGTTSTSAFLEDAATAKKFLAFAEQEDCRRVSTVNTEQQPDSASGVQPQEQRSRMDDLQPAVSTWSDTTPSEKIASKISEETTQNHDLLIRQEPMSEPMPPLPPQERKPDALVRGHESIGYPSRAPATSDALTSDAQDAVADGPTIAPRQSSPTLGSQAHGSIRRGARASGTASYARPTQAGQARKSSRLPTPRNTTNDTQRGRRTSVRGRATDGGEITAKATRTRSRSRYVMDKINGLFSGKRDKDSLALPAPPLTTAPPSVKEGSSPLVLPELDGTPMHQRSSDILPVPMLPSPLRELLSGLQTEASTATLRTGQTTLVDETPAPRSRKSHDAAMMKALSRFVQKANVERNSKKQGDLLDIVDLVADALMHARQVEIMAEEAKSAARRAEIATEIVQMDYERMQRLVLLFGRDGLRRFR